MAKISLQLLQEEFDNYILRGPDQEDFGFFLNTKYGFNDPNLEEAETASEVYAIVRKKHVKKI